jgi:hypothetical protein
MPDESNLIRPVLFAGPKDRSLSKDRAFFTLAIHPIRDCVLIKGAVRPRFQFPLCFQFPRNAASAVEVIV